MTFMIVTDTYHTESVHGIRSVCRLQSRRNVLLKGKIIVHQFVCHLSPLVLVDIVNKVVIVEFGVGSFV